MQRKFFKTMTTLSMAALLTACAHTTTHPGLAMVNLHTANYLNPDINGKASPVVVTLYQLKSPYNFKQASYAELSDNASRVLGNDLVDKNTLEMRPGSSRTIEQHIDENTQYLGIVAAYRDIQSANWHKVIKVNPTSQANVNINLESQGVVAYLTAPKGN